MANNNATMKGIKNSWSLVAFAKAHGKMQIGEFTNSETGEIFKSCIFACFSYGCAHSQLLFANAFQKYFSPFGKFNILRTRLS